MNWRNAFLDEPIGNVNNQTLRDIWWSPAYQRFRNRQRLAREIAREKSDCLSWCQHLGINRELNCFNPKAYRIGRRLS